MADDYRKVKPTPEEAAEWRSNSPHRAWPYRVQCQCGKRYWLSGLSVGSHRRVCPGPTKGS